MISGKPIAFFAFITFINCLSAQDTTFYFAQGMDSVSTEAACYQILKNEGTQYLVTGFYKHNKVVEMTGKYSSLNPEIKEGLFTWNHPNGKIKHQGNYSSNLETGEHTWYFENGKKKSVENYKNGQRDGYYTAFHSNGSLLEESTYISGRKNGRIKTYHENGALASEGFMVDKDKNGIWSFYSNRGIEIASKQYDRKISIEGANLNFVTPNSKWFCSKKEVATKSFYIFEREAIEDQKGMKITPTIKLYAEDASGYPDVTIFAAAKKMKYLSSAMKVEETITPEDKNFTIAVPQSIGYKCHYTKDGEEHLFLMVYLLTKKNTGIQLYMDMTKSLEAEYLQEFKKALVEIEEL